MSADNMAMIVETCGPEFRVVVIKMSEFDTALDGNPDATDSDYLNWYRDCFSIENNGRVFPDKESALDYAETLIEEYPIEYGIEHHKLDTYWFVG
jgi:hypothetical protein